MTVPRLCIVLADRARARYFVASETESGRLRLIEQVGLTNQDQSRRGDDAPEVRTERNTDRASGPVHPQFEQRTQHRRELEERFAHAVVDRALEIVTGWPDGEVVVAAPPHTLGLLRPTLRARFPAQLTLRDLPREYINLTSAQLARQHDVLAQGEARSGA